jgi:hypothetical protein
MMASFGAMKERKGWESSKNKGGNSGDEGARFQLPQRVQARVSLGRAAAVHYFPNCESAELGVDPTQLPQVLAPYVGNERTLWNG